MQANVEVGDSISLGSVVPLILQAITDRRVQILVATVAALAHGAHLDQCGRNIENGHVVCRASFESDGVNPRPTLDDHERNVESLMPSVKD